MDPPPATDPTPSAPRSQNRLALEKSPYLLQHADNPVDWYPWGEAAFARAAQLDRPVFLSVGYATCHWCHVMAHESFEDDAVAARLNEVFVPVKVDREERPDVDDLYMTVCHLMNGSGGWPLTVLLTPDRRPFFAGTYFPKHSRFGRLGLVELIDKVEALWRDRRNNVERSAEVLVAALHKESVVVPGADPGPELLDRAFEQLRSRFDARHGGFGDAPKFPTPHNLLALLRYGRRTGNAEATDMVQATLTAMRRGGVFDQIGLGFHRYSTDARWHLPHFEKMLYDQSLLALAYLEGYQATGAPALRDTAEEIFRYVLRDLRGPDGALYAAEDADSEGEEGRFYVWTEAELRDVLGDEADLAIRAWGVRPEGNFRDEASGQPTGANVLYQAIEGPQLARDTGATADEVQARLERARQRLLARRGARPRPLRDDKVLADLSGLAIAALARGARVLGDPDLAGAARAAWAFVDHHLRQDDGRLLHRYRDGEAALPGVLDDHAFLIWGLLELYEATFQVDLLEQALALQAIQDRHFWDEKHGGYFLTADDAEALLVRRKVVYDGAVPSGNSVAALNLLRLARITGDTALEERAAQLMRAFSSQVTALPSAHTFLLMALDFALGPSREVVISGDGSAPDTEALLAVVRRTYLPNAVLLMRDESNGPRLDRLTGFTALKQPRGGATAYVCEGQQCEKPVTRPAALAALLTPPAGG